MLELPLHRHLFFYPVIDPWIYACQARLDAERTRDPALYAFAAEMFALAGYTCAADRMRARAEYYQEVFRPAE